MGVRSAATTGASRNRIGACTRGSTSWADLAVRVVQGWNRFIPPLAGALIGLSNARVAADRTPERMDDGRVVRDFKFEPTTREVYSRKAVTRAV